MALNKGSKGSVALLDDVTTKPLPPVQGGRYSAGSGRYHFSGQIYAALDLGTNNCRLLVATPEYKQGSTIPSLRILDSYSRIVRLGEGVSTSGKLSADAMQRTLAALKVCRNKLDKYPRAKIRLVATEACRRASNAKGFLKQIQTETGLRIEIITNEEEARLAFYGCSSLLRDEAQKALTFDIGGGSTEFMWVERQGAKLNPQILGWNSIPYGVMNLSEQFGGAAYTEMYFDEIVAKLRKMLSEFDAKHGIAEEVKAGKTDIQLLSTSGTVTTLAAVHLDLPRYDRAKVDGVSILFDDMQASVRRLLAMSPVERSNHPCVGSQRADYIISGCAILEAIHSLWPLSHITIADRGVREGVIINMLQNKQKQNIK